MRWRQSLEELVAERTRELASANEELERIEELVVETAGISLAILPAADLVFHGYVSAASLWTVLGPSRAAA